MVELKNYPGYYVDELGKVYSTRHGSLKEKSLRLDKTGYVYVMLCINGKYYRRRVHRLVAEAFIANPNNLPEVNHKDEDKTNNYVDNLEWCTSKYNTNYGNARYNLNRLISDPSRPRRNNTSGRKGVTRKGNYWAVHFNRKYLGTFKTFDEAVRAREKAEKEAYNF